MPIHKDIVKIFLAGEYHYLQIYVQNWDGIQQIWMFILFSHITATDMDQICQKSNVKNLHIDRKNVPLEIV